MRIKSADHTLLAFGILAAVGAVARLAFYKGTNNYIASGVIFIVGTYLLYRVYDRAKNDKNEGEEER